MWVPNNDPKKGIASMKKFLVLLTLAAGLTDLEHILRSLFRQENVTIQWIYSQRGLDTVFITIHENQKDQRPILPPTRPFDYGSNVMGNIPVPSINQTTVLGNATESPENIHVSEIGKVAVPPPPPPVKPGFVPTPAPSVKHGYVPPPPMPPGFLSR